MDPVACVDRDCMVNWLGCYSARLVKTHNLQVQASRIGAHSWEGKLAASVFGIGDE